MPGSPKITEVADQEQPIVQVVGRIAAETDESNGSGTKYLLHCGWSRKTFQVSNRGLKVLKSMDIRVIDEPNDYTI